MRRALLSSLLLGSALTLLFGSAAGAIGPPPEPIEIGTSPQFVFDNYVIDNHWALKYKREAVRRVFHQPQKHAGNPLITGDGGFGTMLRDDETGLFRFWYQTWIPSGEKGKSGSYAVAYAESKDGLNWVLPKLGRYEWNGTKENNIVWLGINGKRASSPVFLELPERDRRGFRYVMLYRETDGCRIIGSHDGLNWDRESDTRIAHLHSDTQNSIVYDAEGDQYVMFCRAKHIYRTFKGDIIDTGASRRVSRMANKELWTLWESEPQTLLIPDELDARESFNFFYGMPVRVYGGVYWGFLWPFKMNSDIHTELAVSRDGVHFERHPERPKLIERGPDGAWDDGMVFAGHQWVEVGDEWWIYYTGWDGPHGIRERTAGVGLAKLRKEGFASLRFPAGGGAAVTRKLKWPGGKLLVNADAEEGELRVRVTDARRKVLPGFDYADCTPFTGDSTAHEVTWKERTLESLAGETIRVEFFLKNADLYTFRASP